MHRRERGSRLPDADRMPNPPRLGRAALALALGMALAVLLAACGEPQPSGSSPSPSASASVSPTASPTPTRSPSASPSPSPSRTASPRPTASPTPTRTPSPSPSLACPSDNAVRAWYYVPNASHKTPAVPSDAARLLRRYGGHYVGDTRAKVVYLTFDEGYENGYTGEILDALRAARVQAAFFVTGSYVRNNPELVRRMVAEGHVVASHTNSHPSLPSLAREPAAFAREFQVVERDFRRVTGAELERFLRPPMGEYSALSLCRTQRLGYATVFWSFAHRDWLVDDQPSVAETVRRILAGSHPGAIYLLHAVSRSNTEALPQAIAGLRKQGYRFGSLNELK